MRLQLLGELTVLPKPPRWIWGKEWGREGKGSQTPSRTKNLAIALLRKQYLSATPAMFNNLQHIAQFTHEWDATVSHRILQNFLSKTVDPTNHQLHM